MRILIADSQAKVRRALQMRLEQADQIQVVGEATDAPNLLSRIVNTAADLVLLDGNLPGLPMAELLSVLRQAWPQLRIIVLSTRPEAGPTALEAGADAFVSKSDPAEHLLAAIEKCRRLVENGPRIPVEAAVLSLEVRGGNDGKGSGR
jgi:two-component system response regulator DesR